MDICARWYVGEEEFGEVESEGVAHGVDEYVWYEEEECVEGEKKRAEGLPEESEVWPCRREDIAAGGQIHKVKGLRVELDIEAVLDAFNDRFFRRIVVARVDDTGRPRPALLSRLDRGPEHAFTAAASITKSI